MNFQCFLKTSPECSSSTNCPTTLYSIDQMLLCAFWSDLHNTTSSDSSLMIDNLLTTKYFTAYLDFLAITTSSSALQFSVGQFSYSTFGSSLAAAATASDHSWLSFFGVASHADISISSLAPVLHVANHGRGRCTWRFQDLCKTKCLGSVLYA